MPSGAPRLLLQCTNLVFLTLLAIVFGFGLTGMSWSLPNIGRDVMTKSGELLESCHKEFPNEHINHSNTRYKVLSALSEQITWAHWDFKAKFHPLRGNSVASKSLPSHLASRRFAFSLSISTLINTLKKNKCREPTYIPL